MSFVLKWLFSFPNYFLGRKKTTLGFSYILGIVENDKLGTLYQSDTTPVPTYLKYNLYALQELVGTDTVNHQERVSSTRLGGLALVSGGDSSEESRGPQRRVESAHKNVQSTKISNRERIKRNGIENLKVAR